MENTDEVRGSGGSRAHGEKRAARCVVDIIPESGPGKVGTRESVMHSIGSGSRRFLAKEHFAGAMLAPARELRASRFKEADAQTGSLAVYPAGIDGRLTWSGTREIAVVSTSPEAPSGLAVREFDPVEAVRAARNA